MSAVRGVVSCEEGLADERLHHCLFSLDYTLINSRGIQTNHLPFTPYQYASRRTSQLVSSAPFLTHKGRKLDLMPNRIPDRRATGIPTFCRTLLFLFHRHRIVTFVNNTYGRVAGNRPPYQIGQGTKLNSNTPCTDNITEHSFITISDFTGIGYCSVNRHRNGDEVSG